MNQQPSNPATQQPKESNLPFSPCSGGTFGVVFSPTIKARPTHPMYEHSLAILPLNSTESSISLLLNATAKVVSKFSILSDAGLSGYVLAGDGTLDSGELPKAFYGHGFGVLMPHNNTLANNELAFPSSNPLSTRRLLKTCYHTTEKISTSHLAGHTTLHLHPTTTPAAVWPVGNTNIMLSSRMFGKTSLLNNTTKLSNILHTVFTDGSNNTTIYPQTRPSSS
jgi:hypothetical protein